MTAGGYADAVRSLSRELALACDAGGTILWADARASELLGARPGQALRSLAVDGSGGRVDQFLRHAPDTPGRPWELAMLVNGRPATLAVWAARIPSGLGVVGSLVTEDFAQALEQVTSTLTEVAELQRETVRQRAELAARNGELVRVNRELEDSNRGVINLYAELDEKSDSLRRTAEVKSRVVANVSHEFRTPINSIAGLARLLLENSDGPLNDEQRRQVGFILKSADELSVLVSDLLDLSKLESGTLRLRPAPFDVSKLFAALRGTLRPLHTNPAVTLVFEAPGPLPVLNTDETKVSQILRNLISNAVKFTERGEVHVRAWSPAPGRIAFGVRDTGVGIAEENLERVFEEFTQIENPMQRKVKGTGLGLSLSRRLAEILGGALRVESTLGEGSTFTLEVPAVHPEVSELDALQARSASMQPGRSPVLVVEDDRQTLLLYEKYLRDSGFQVVPARSTDEARDLMRRMRPAAVVLDIMLDGEASWSFLSEMKEDATTRDIPILVVTVTDREQKARALGADEFWMKPMDQQWLLRRLRALARNGPVSKVLVVDDDEVSRYLVRRLLQDTEYRIVEAAGGAEGVRRAREELPHVILLDFVMPDMGAFEVLDELKKDPVTRSIPVIVHTSKNLDEDERKRLSVETAAILNKQSLSREIAIARIREALVKAGVGGDAQR